MLNYDQKVNFQIFLYDIGYKNQYEFTKKSEYNDRRYHRYGGYIKQPQTYDEKLNNRYFKLEDKTMRHKSKNKKWVHNLYDMLYDKSKICKRCKEIGFDNYNNRYCKSCAMEL